MRFYFCAAAALLVALSCLGSDAKAPPSGLIEENCGKAEAIVSGRILASKTPQNQFTETKLKVLKVYRGPFQVDEEITYYSFRESGERSKAELNGTRIIFLVSRTEAGGEKKWGTATDFSEFDDSPALRRLLKKCERTKR